MTVAASPTIAAETQAQPAELWAIAQLKEPNWRTGVKTRTAYTTDITTAKSDAEQRRGLLGRPYRTSSAKFHSLSTKNLLDLQASMQRSAQARHLFPLFSDQSILTGTASGTAVPCDTTYRRLFVGARVVLFNTSTKAFETGIIASKTGSQITLQDSLVASFPAGSLVWPLLECRIRLSQKAAILNDTIIEVDLDGAELPSPGCLDPTCDPNTVPAGFSSYSGYPILDLAPDFSRQGSISLARTGDFSNSGITQVATLHGRRARYGRTIPFTFFDRASAWKFITFFDSRCGRVFPFWVPSPTSDYSFVAWTVNGVKVTATGAEQDWTYRPYICAYFLDGHVEIRSIVSHSRSSGVDTLVLDSPFTVAQPTQMGMAHLMRFDQDEMVESWHTDAVVEIDAPLIEVDQEKSVTIADLDAQKVQSLPNAFEPTVDGGNGPIVPMYYWPCGAPNERPTGRAADLRLPEKMEITVLPEFEADPAFPILSGSVSAELLAALPGTYRAEYVGATSSTSSHWHHVFMCISASVLTFCHSGNSMGVTRHLWRTTKNYSGASGTETITVDVVAEVPSAPDVNPGCGGTLISIYVYCSEVNKDYVDGTNFTPRSNYNFNISNPAVWGSLAGGGLDDKWCHPRMLLMASVPTSWTAPCGNQGWGCQTADVLNGFAACKGVLNGAPWVGSDPDLCPGNTCFDPGIGASRSIPVTLGGGCPTSSLFAHLIVENRQGLGVTALKPTRSGWDEATGTLDVVGGASIEINPCLPSQSDLSIGCCESNLDDPFAGSGGSPTCWRPSDGAPDACNPGTEGLKCCFPVDSIVTVTVTQRCICNTVQYGPSNGLTCDGVPGSACPDTNPVSICGTRTATFQLTVCDMVFVQGGNQNLRQMDWDTYVRNPSYAWQDYEDDFDPIGGLGWNAGQGTWDFNAAGDMAEATTPGSLTKAPHFAALTNYSGYLNCVVEVDCLSPDVEQGIVVRSQSSGSPTDCYGATVDPATKTLAIFKFLTADTRTLLASITDLEFETPCRLRVTAKGADITAVVDDDQTMTLTVSDCEFTSGGNVGLVGYGDVAHPSQFDNFSIADNTQDGMVRIHVWYNDNGWNVSVPVQAMPYYPQDLNGCVADSNPGCNGAPPDGCECVRILREAQPGNIFIDQTSPYVSLADAGKPWVGYGGPFSPMGCVGCGSGTVPCAPYDDWLACSVRVNKTCSDTPCDPAAENRCVGIDYWVGSAIFSS